MLSVQKKDNIANIIFRLILRNLNNQTKRIIIWQLQNKK